MDDFDDYNPTADFAASIDECYRAIRERVAAGGPGWGGWPAGVHPDAGGQGVAQQPRRRPDSFSPLAVEDRAAPLPPPLHQHTRAGVMKWYKHDPSAALAGMFGLSVEERGAYYTLIDLLYARDGSGVTDELVCGALACHGRTWNALKKRLIGKGKIWVQADGTLMAKRVENALKESRNFVEKQAKRARKKWHSEENQELANAIARNASTTTTTLETSSFPIAARESEKRKKKRKNRSAGSLASARPTGALARQPKTVASPSLEEIIQAKGWKDER